jgi:hypothetical protein
MLRIFTIFLLTFSICNSKTNITNPSTLELFLFKIGFTSLLKDVDTLKTKSELTNKDITILNDKIEYLYKKSLKDNIQLENDIEIVDLILNEKKDITNKLERTIDILENKIIKLEKRLNSISVKSKEFTNKDNVFIQKYGINKIWSNYRKFQYFLNSPPTFFTINLTFENTLQASKYFLRKYNLLDYGYFFRYGKKLDNTKVLYGVYETYEESKEVLNSMNKDFVNLHKPYIDRLRDYQNLYNIRGN